MNVVSPYLAVGPQPYKPAGSAQQAAPAPVDTVASSTEQPKTLTLKDAAKIGGAVLLAGAAIAGGAALVSKAADAVPSKASVMSTQWHRGGYYHGGGGYYRGWGGGWGWGPRWYPPVVPVPIYPPVVPIYPAPIPVPVPVPVPTFPYGGYNAVGCDGVYHHFDANGHVFDQSGHYQLLQNGWGGCYRNYNVIN